MSIRSVNEIISLSDSHGNPDKIAYKHLIKQIDIQIREHAHSHGSITFQTPNIIWGKPMFDCKKVEKKLMKHYTSIGFSTFNNEKGEVIIKWLEDVDPKSESDTDESVSESEEEEEETDLIGEESSESEKEEEESVKKIPVETLPLSKRLGMINTEIENKK